MSKFDPNEWARKRKLQVERAKLLREQRLRKQRQLQDNPSRKGNTSSQMMNQRNQSSSAREYRRGDSSARRKQAVGNKRSEAVTPKRSKQGRNRPKAFRAEGTYNSDKNTENKNVWTPTRSSPVMGITQAGTKAGEPSIDDILKQTLASMDSLDRLSKQHEIEFVKSTVLDHKGHGSNHSAVVRRGKTQGGLGRATKSSPSKYHAARSHEMNDKYMEDWHEAYDTLQAAAGKNEDRKRLPHGGKPPLSPSSRKSLMVVQPHRKELAAKSSRRHASRNTPEHHEQKLSTHSMSKRMASVSLDGLSNGWYSGPKRAKIKPFVIPSSGRPILCLSMQGNEAVVGSSDHALYGYNVTTGKQTRRLFGKRFYHSEWVTCVSHLSDGRVVSGGMDSKLLLWASHGNTCQELRGHTGSISTVSTLSSGLIVSGSYDKTVRLWNCQTRRQTACLTGHRAPVLSLDVGPTHAVSGSRSGMAMAWDIITGKSIGCLKGHKGHLTSVKWVHIGANNSIEQDTKASNIFLTGAQDGHVRAWDLRAKKSLANVSAHVSSKGSGAVAGIGISADGFTAVSAGADKGICLLDVRKGFVIRHRAMEHRDFIYELKVVGDLVVTGGGDGTIWCHSTSNDKAMWSEKPLHNAIRCIGATNRHLFLSGDDGTAIIYSFA